MHKETAQHGKYFCFKVFSPDDVYAAVAMTRGYRKGNSGARHIRKREIKIWQNVSSSGSTFGCEWWRCALWWTSLVASNVSFSVLIKRLDLFFLIGNSWRTQKWVPVNLKSCLRFIFSEAKDGKKKRRDRKTMIHDWLSTIRRCLVFYVSRFWKIKQPVKYFRCYVY